MGLGGTGGSNAGGAGGSAGAGELPAFVITTPVVTLPPASTVSYCYYFNTPNTAALAIRKWTSEMTSRAHHITLYAGSAGQPMDGTLDTAPCGAGTGSAPSPWLYASHTAQGELTLPADDGTGKPLGMALPARHPVFLNMYFVNVDDVTTVTANVTLTAYAHPAGTTYTQTDAFVAYNASLSIPAGAMNAVASATCSAPSGVKFWRLSTESHGQSAATELRDGNSVVFTSTDWERPGAMSWLAPPFHSFASGAMTYACTYNNTGPNMNRVIRSGPSLQTDEVCMGIGYFFPSTGPKFCVDNTSLGP